MANNYADLAIFNFDNHTNTFRDPGVNSVSGNISLKIIDKSINDDTCTFK